MSLWLHLLRGLQDGGKKGRYRNPQKVVDEIEVVLGQGFSKINIVDDLLTLNHKHVNAICDEITARNLKFEWTAFSRVDTINRELVTRMKETGCSAFCYGVESGNQEILNRIRKRITLDKVREAVKLAKEIGVEPFASFIIGLPGETAETLQQSVDFGKELYTPYGFHLLAPFPGTEIREKAKEYGLRILTNDWSRYNANEPITETEGATAEMLSKVDREFHESLYKYLRDLEELEDKGELDEQRSTELKKRRRSDIARTLLQQDIIEGLGRTRATPDPIAELTMELSRRTTFSIQHLKEALQQLISEGVLRYEKSGEYLTWRWNQD